MKKCAFFLFLTTLLFSCGKTDEEINYVEVNGQSHILRYAFCEDYGATVYDDYLYREYYIELLSDDSPVPKSQLGFSFYSNDTKGIGEGTYYLGDGSGLFFDVFTRVNMRWRNNQLVEGDFFSNLDPSYDNRIKISSNKRGKVFDVRLRFLKGGETYTVIAHYEEGLTYYTNY